MPDDAKNPPQGAASCHDCGAEVTARLNSNRKTYYFCECGAHHRWNFKISREMTKAAAVHGADAIRFVAGQDGELICEIPSATPDPEPGPGPGPGPGPANDNPGPDPAPERRRAGFRRR